MSARQCEQCGEVPVWGQCCAGEPAGITAISPTGVECRAVFEWGRGWTIDGSGYFTADELADMGYYPWRDLVND